MSDGKVFSQETKKLIVKAADDAIKLPFYAEPFDGPAIKVLVNFIDSKADKYVPDNIDPLINAGITAGIKGDLDLASLHIGQAINQVVDIPLLEEDTEQKMFVDGVRLILRILDTWIQKKKDAENAE